MMIGLETYAATSTLGVDVKESLKKLGRQVIPAASAAASDALADKPGTPQGGASSPASTPQAHPSHSDGFLSKTIVAPVRVWHALVGAAVAGVGAVAWWKLR